MLANSGVNTSDMTTVANILNIYYNRTYTAAEYQAILNHCTDLSASYVLAKEGAEAASVKASYAYGFGGQMLDNEVVGEGGIYTAEHWQYDSRLGRRWNIDPVIKSWQSGYACFSDNPIIMIDPNGDADFYNQSGKKVGTDGVNDGKLYILTTQADVKKAQQSYFGKGIRGFFARLTGNGGKGTIQLSEFKGDVVALPSANIRAKIGAAVDRSNKPTADDSKGGFHEEGGTFGLDANGKEIAVDANPGKYSNPKTNTKASVNVFDAANPSEAEAVRVIQGTYHIHPAGRVSESPEASTPGTFTAGGTTTSYGFVQTPSDIDVSVATQGNPSGYNVVVGAGNNTVYIHGSSGQNQSGTNYRASFPLDKFRSIGNEK